MIPQWSKRAMLAMAHFWRPLQDIDVYVEDADSQPFYLALLGRLVPRPVRIRTVFPLGGRVEVLRRAQMYDPVKDGYALFLIDGDFPWVRGEPPPVVDGLYQLQAYCVENLLIDRDALVELFHECAACTMDDAHQGLGLDQWYAEVSPLILLSVCFASLNRIESTIATLSTCSVRDLLDGSGKRARLDEFKVYDKCVEVNRLLENTNDGLAVRDQVFRRVAELPEPLYSVSGKTYLIPLIEFWLNSRNSKVGTRDSLKIRLAKKVSLDRLAELQRAIERACNGQHVHHKTNGGTKPP